MVVHVPVTLWLSHHPQCLEMVEHDTPPDERKTIVEEPHKMEKEKYQEGESKTEESQELPSEAEGKAYTGVSTFFSGFASMVQTTVRVIYIT